MGYCCSNGVIHLEEGQANGAWKDIRKRFPVGTTGLRSSRGFHLWKVCGHQDQSYG